jgi:uncharacterized membrane protein (DUF485 family)
MKTKKKEKKKKETILESIIFIILFVGFPILASAIVEILSSIITMEMNTIGILFIISIIYIIGK